MAKDDDGPKGKLKSMGMVWNRFLKGGEAITFNVLRIVLGVIMTVHGGMKLANPEETAAAFSSMGIPFAEVSVYLAVAGELLGGLGLVFGLLTRAAAIGPALTMVAAILFVHLGNGLLASNNGWEYPLVIFLLALHYAFRGPGSFSVDALLARMRSEKRQKDHGLGSARTA